MEEREIPSNDSTPFEGRVVTIPGIEGRSLTSEEERAFEESLGLEAKPSSQVVGMCLDVTDVDPDSGHKRRFKCECDKCELCIILSCMAICLCSVVGGVLIWKFGFNDFLGRTEEDKCIPERLNDIIHANRKEVKTLNGWQVKYTCIKESTSNGFPKYLSYHYPSGEATYECTTGSDFVVQKPISCQGKTTIFLGYFPARPAG